MATLDTHLEFIVRVLNDGSPVVDGEQRDLHEVGELWKQTRFTESWLRAVKLGYKDTKYHLVNRFFHQRMKQIVRHLKNCENRRNCFKCRKLVMLCFYHAAYCQKTDCKVLFCSRYKIKIEQCCNAKSQQAGK